MARLFLLRHAQPVTDGVKRFVGQTDPHLSREGRRQAEWWHNRLKKIDFKAIYSSDLVRARETADLVAGRRHGRITTLAALREIHLGAWENRPFSDIRREFPRQWDARGLDLAGYRPPGGESFADLQSRVLPEIRKLIDGQAGNILVVAHAGVNRVILCSLTGIPLDRLFVFGQDPAGLNIIVDHPPGHRVTAANLSPETLALAGVVPPA